MFKDWDDFYLLIGSAAGALIGLLFVVVTLNTGLDRRQALRGASIYMSPLVFHLAVVLVLSGVAMTPRLPPGAVTGLVLACAGLGLALAASVVVRIRRRPFVETPHWSDVWLYGVLPGAIYLALGAVGAALPAWTCATYALAAALMALLLSAVRNAWDLVTWLAPKARED